LRRPNVRHAPSASKADAQIRGDELAVVALQLVAGRAVDDVHAEMVAPVAAPFRLVIALHDEDEFLDVLRHAGEPGVVFRRVIVFVRRQQLDDRAERAFRESTARLSVRDLSAKRFE
jgi:hypothetical protein